MREQRETPRDILRALGQMLAPTSQAIASSSSPGEERRTSLAKVLEEDDDDSLPIDAPRLSLPIDVDDDSDLRPPRSSGLEEENYTMQSVEFPRRAYSEQPSRLSRGSFGTVDLSDVTGTVNLDGGDDRANFPIMTFEDWGLGAALGDVTFERYVVWDAVHLLVPTKGTNFSLASMKPRGGRQLWPSIVRVALVSMSSPM